MAIEIIKLKKSFGEKDVLKGIDIVFEQGKINMIIGASGSGKSVMLKCIVGLMRPDSGQVLYDGMDFHRASHKEVRNFRKNMGMLFQYSALFDSMTVEENIAFPLKLFTKYTKKAIKKRVDFCMERVTMAGTNNLLPAELSGGMKKRVGIARAIALNPKYLFVDEPNSGLDPLTASVIDELIKEITYEYNMCTVVVSHDMNSVVNISDNIMFLYKGHKEWEGDKRAILKSGNDNIDKFVFVSDLIRRDIYDDVPEDGKAKEKAFDGQKKGGNEKKSAPVKQEKSHAEKGKTEVPVKKDGTNAEKGKQEQPAKKETGNAEQGKTTVPVKKENPNAGKGKTEGTNAEKGKAEEPVNKESQDSKSAEKPTVTAEQKENGTAEEAKEKSEGDAAEGKTDLKDKLAKDKGASASTPKRQTPSSKGGHRDPRHRGTRRKPRRRPPGK